MKNDPHDSDSDEAEAAMEEHPVTVSLGPMGSLLRQLHSAKAWRYSRLKGVQAEIKILCKGLKGLCTDLKDLSEADDTLTMCWVRQVRDLCYDTSDYLDDLLHFIHSSSRTRPRNRPKFKKKKKNRPRIFRVSRRLKKLNRVPLIAKKRVPLIAKLSALVARVEEADERRERFKISPPQASSKHDCAEATGVNHLMPTIPLQVHIDNLIKLLGFHHDHNERNLGVATIFGSAGVGKTVVARTMYHKYGRRFQYRAFLRVSRDPDTRRLLADLLSQIKAPTAYAFADVQGLTAAITKHLQGKSYIIVIDDLWDTSPWDIIRHALPDAEDCRIITTTQIEDVALACCCDQLKHIYEITPLTLYRRDTLSDKNALYQKRNEITPLSNDQSGISEDGFTTYPSTKGMKEALNLVYNNLPLHLKTCLLYMNIYPEGWTIKKDELVKQWVAEGFIESVQGQDLETAGCYFDALVSTGMVQSVDINHNNEVLSCTIHHMVLDLIRQKSMEENFVTIVNYFQTIIGLPDKVRRLSVQLGGAKGANNISGNIRISQVRSLIFSGYFKSVPSIMEYGLLQVLILYIWSDQDTEEFDLTTIGELYRLRYLKINCSIRVKLPCKIRRLRLLGTLQVDARLHAVPSDIVHLDNLLHLSLPSESILPHGVGRMTCLRTLGYFDIGCNSEENVRALGELKNLQDLQLTCSTVQPAEIPEKNVQLLLGSVLHKLSMLQSVTLVPAAGSSTANTLQDGDGASRMSISCHGSSNVLPAPAHLQRLELSGRCCIFCRLPKWIGELTILRILKIAVRELSEEDIDILKGLPALTALSLHVQPMTAEMIIFGKPGFSVLTYFKLTCTVHCLIFKAHAMPNLEKLKLCLNSPIVDEQGTTRVIIIERLLGLKEIFAIIGSAGVDSVSAWWKAIRNDPNNPQLQLTGSIYYGDKGRGIMTREGSGEDIRVHMQQKSSRPSVPDLAAHCREKAPEDQTFKSEKIIIPSVSERMDGHAGQAWLRKQPFLARGRENADHLKDMAAQLLIMLSAKGGRKAWDQLRGKLGQVATYVANPRVVLDDLLELLKDEGVTSFLHLDLPKADALLRRVMSFLREEIPRERIMESLKEKTRGARDTGTPIARFRELLLVVAGQLDMLPLCDSEPMHMVDGDRNFCDANVESIIKCSPQLSASNAPYAVVSIVGAQSSGKSYLLNRLFGTNFPEMNPYCGRMQTTRGIMMSRCIGPSLLVLDVEGFDGIKEGQDTLFEKQAALFALTVSDVMLVNMSVFDIGREQAGATLLFKTIFKERTKLAAGLTNILVVLRMYDGETPLELLKDYVMKSLEKTWKRVNVESKFEDYIEVNVVGLPDKNSPDFLKEVTKLRRILSNNTIINCNGSGKVPASSFSFSSRELWMKLSTM